MYTLTTLCIIASSHVQSYDDGEGCKGVWLLCFNSEYELAKFETALASLWREEFQVGSIWFQTLFLAIGSIYYQEFL